MRRIVIEPQEDIGGHAELCAALDERADGFTPSERALAAWFRDNMNVIPYETGAQVAAAAGVSEMTVIRFVRSLGYANLRDLKDKLRPPLSTESAALDNVAERFTNCSSDIGQLAESLERELEAIRRAYEAATTRRWTHIVERILDARLIHVAGFQATRGVAMDFTSRLKFVRAGVRFAEGTAGVFADVLESDPETTLLVIIDTAAYARKGVQLARKAAELGMPMVIVTDRFSHWAREFTEDVLEMNTHVGTFWDSTASLSAVLNLLIHFTAARLGDAAIQRRASLGKLGQYFQEYDIAASRWSEPARLRRGSQSKSEEG